MLHDFIVIFEVSIWHMEAIFVFIFISVFISSFLFTLFFIL